MPCEIAWQLLEACPKQALFMQCQFDGGKRLGDHAHFGCSFAFTLNSDPVIALWDVNTFECPTVGLLGKGFQFRVFADFLSGAKV
jgi:hypothetical protein